MREQNFAPTVCVWLTLRSATTYSQDPGLISFNFSETFSRSGGQKYPRNRSVALRPDLFELLLLARRDVDLGAVLRERRGNHRANAGSTASDHGCLWR
jgi:hypothetical protein